MLFCIFFAFCDYNKGECCGALFLRQSIKGKADAKKHHYVVMKIWTNFL